MNQNNMTPDQQKQFEDMQKRIANLEKVTNLDAFENMVRRLGDKSKFVITKSITNPPDTDIDRTISIPAMGGTAQVLDYPDEMAQIVIKGVTYRFGLYNESRF